MTDDLFAGLHIYYIPTDHDRERFARCPEGFDRDRLGEWATRRRVGYVLGRSEDWITWVLDDPHYADDEYGQFEIRHEGVHGFLMTIRRMNMELFLPTQQLVSRNALARCIRPGGEDL